MIRKNLKELGRATAIYGVGNISSKLAAFLLIPVYTKFLSIEDVGTIALIELVEMFFLGVGSMGIYPAVWRYIGQANEENKRKIIFSGYLGLVVGNLVVLGLISFGFEQISKFIGLSSARDYPLIFFILLNVLFQFGGLFLLSLWQFQEKPRAFVVLSVFQLIGILGLSVYFVIYLHLGLWGVVIAKSITLGFVFMISLYTMLKNYITVPSLEVFLKLIRFGAPLVLLGLVTPVLTLSDRFFLNMFVPLSMIGIYSINYKFGMLINMFLVVPLQRGLLPMIYKQGLKDEMQPIYKDTIFYYLVIGCFMILGITFFIRPVIALIASSEYLEATYIVPVVAAAYLISGFRPFFTPLVALKDRTDLLGKAAGVGIFICLGLNYVLISQYGITGAAAATILSYIIFTTIVYVISRKITPMDWGWMRIGKVAALTGAIIASVKMAVNYWNGSEMILGGIGILSFPIFLWAFRIIGEREINGVKSITQFIRNKISRS